MLQWIQVRTWTIEWTMSEHDMISKIMAHQHLVLVNHRCMDIIKFHQTRLTNVFLHPPVHPFGLEGLTNLCFKHKIWSLQDEQRLRAKVHGRWDLAHYPGSHLGLEDVFWTSRKGAALWKCWVLVHMTVRCFHVVQGFTRVQTPAGTAWLGTEVWRAHCCQRAAERSLQQGSDSCPLNACYITSYDIMVKLCLACVSTHSTDDITSPGKIPSLLQPFLRSFVYTVKASKLSKW